MGIKVRSPCCAHTHMLDESVALLAAHHIIFPRSHHFNSLSLSPSPQSLSKLLGDNAPACRRDQKFDNYFGRKIAVDASMHIYQFMVSERWRDELRRPRLSVPASLSHAHISPHHFFHRSSSAAWATSS
jgi:hypothetical protein